MNNRIEKDEHRIRGMDFIQNLLEAETVSELNKEYSELLMGLNGQKNIMMSDELAEALKEFKGIRMRYSTSPVITGRGNYIGAADFHLFFIKRDKSRNTL